MDRLRQRLAALPADAGISLVEVMVALLVFSIAATGLAAGAMSISRITSDSRSRQVATNLAAEDLDAARAVGDALKVTAGDARTDTTTDPGHVYTITREVSIVDAAGADIKCGTTSTFAYRRVTVKVDWTGRLATTSPVRSDTVLALNSPVNDAGTGAMSIRVIGSDGTPRTGVAVTVTPVSAGKTLSVQPDPTDEEGCAYASRVTPGTYKVVLAKTDYVDTAQQLQPTTTTAVVAAGSTYGWTVQYDLAVTYATAYAGNYSGKATLPADLVTTFVPDNPTYKPVTRSPAKDSQQLHPLSGYSAVAGSFMDENLNTTCASADPRNWPAGKVGSKTMLAGERATAPSAKPGGSAAFGTAATASIPMGVVRVTGLPLTTIVATNTTSGNGNSGNGNGNGNGNSGNGNSGNGNGNSGNGNGNSGSGDPGCGTPATYRFSSVLGTNTIALPFGTWSLSTSLLGVTVPINLSQVSVLTNESPNGVTSSLLGGTTVVLDPRREAK